MEYRFQTSVYDQTALLAEIAAALEKRMEKASRKRLPGLWAVIDRKAEGKVFKEMTKGRRIYRRVVGTLLLLVGLFLAIPGLAAPDKLLGPLLAGLFAIGTAVYYLRSTRKNRVSTFEKQAKKLLAVIAKAPSQQVSFTERGLQLPGQAAVPYENILFYTETPSGVLLNWAEQATFLQKADLQEADWANFSSWLQARLVHLREEPPKP